MKRSLLALALLLAAPAFAAEPRNIVIFVADGLRYGSVTPENTPNLWRLKTEGVDFANSHSLFPTVTTANASAIATGHYIGDTGNFGNTVYAGEPFAHSKGSPTPDYETNQTITEMNARFGGNYLGETSLLAAARKAGFQTAAFGKVGPTRIQDAAAKPDGSETLIVDDDIGRKDDLTHPAWFSDGLKANFLGDKAPLKAIPNFAQPIYLMNALTRVVLPRFAAASKPFALIFWSREPDGTQHDAEDSIGSLSPGINGISGLAAIRLADSLLGELLAALQARGLDKTTDVFVTADHGFYTIARDSRTSPSLRAAKAPVPAELDSAFFARDLALGLGMKRTATGSETSGSSAIGDDPAKPRVIVATNGGAELVYLPNGDSKRLANTIVRLLAAQDYVSGIFVNDRLGRIGGTLPMSAVNLVGAARTPVPDLVVNFRTAALDCPDPLQCAVGVIDSSRATGQGSHGALSRAATRNFMAAIGPGFKARHVDQAPVGNADIAPTMAHLAGIPLPSVGKLKGRVLTEALPGGAEMAVTRKTIVGPPGPDGLRTILNEQAVGETRYFDAAGFEGRTVGLATKP